MGSLPPGNPAPRFLLFPSGINHRFINAGSIPLAGGRLLFPGRFPMSKRSAKPFSRAGLRFPQGKTRPIRHDRRPLLELLVDRIVPSTAYFSGDESVAHPILPVALQQAATQMLTVNYAVVPGGTAV